MKDDGRSDITNRWMAFHLADLLDRAKKAPPAEKTAAEQQCVDLILKLWMHRAEMQGHRRPMKGFEGVFRYLERIGQDQPVYYQAPDVELSQEATDWLQLAEGLDYTARALIRWCVASASVEAAKTDARWATDSVARMLGDGPDMASARVILYDVQMFHGGEANLNEEQLRAQQLQKIRERLEGVLDLAAGMKDEVDAKLGKSRSKSKAAKKKKFPKRRPKH